MHVGVSYWGEHVEFNTNLKFIHQLHFSFTRNNVYYQMKMSNCYCAPFSANTEFCSRD